MAMNSRFLRFLSARATSILAGGIFLGLVWPEAARMMSPLLVPTVVAILTGALVRLDWRQTVAYTRRPGLMVLILLWLLGLSPLVTAFVVALTGPPPGLGTAIVLMAAAPPIMTSIAFTLLLRLDTPLATVAVFLATLVVPLSLPPLALALLDLRLTVGIGELMLRIGGIAFGAAAIAAVIRRLVPGRVLNERADEIDGISVLMILLFGIAIMDGVTATLLRDPGLVALAIGLAFTANLALQAAGAGLFWWLGHRQALTVALVSGNRNMGLMLAALAGAADTEVALYFAVGQLPIYVLPLLLRPLYRRILPT
jgi:predicted Na+-dependent transporter